jgi:fatty-acid peroxygenase
MDQTVALLRQGYTFLPRLRADAGSDVVPLRLLGRRAVAACGPRWVDAFYDESLVQRQGAVPEPVRSTLFGNGAVQGLDDAAHDVRRRLFLEQLDGAAVASLVDLVAARWETAESGWLDRGHVVALSDSARVLLDAVWEWCGLPRIGDADADTAAADMRAMVDGFGSLGRRHLRGRAARRRQERRFTAVVEAYRARQDKPGSVLHAAAFHVDERGEPLPARIAAIELLNLVRPTVAICWWVAFGAHAMHTSPQAREVLRTGLAAEVESVVQELRRFYPFAPFVGGLVRRDATIDGHDLVRRQLLLLDLYGQNHHPDLWDAPEEFRPLRFVGPASVDLLVAQGGGDPERSHRCPGEPATVAVLTALLPRVAALDWSVPEQDVSIPLHRIPTFPRDGMMLDLSRKRR